MKYILCLTIFLTIILQTAVAQSPNSKNTEVYQVAFQQLDQSHFFLSKKIIPQIELPTPFIFLSAFTKDVNFDGELYYRKKLNGQWSKWISFPIDTEGDTPDRIVFLAGELEEATEAVQFRSSTPLSKNLTLRLYAPEHSDATVKSEQGVHSSTSRNDCTCAQPNFCKRSCWCSNGRCPKNPAPSPTTPTHIIVHHSAGNSTALDFKAVVRSYWDYHVKTKGWNDIGYNWLVDPKGVVYEGRGESVQGAHFSCMNSGTTGICMIGNFETATPTDTALTVLQKLIAWEACSKEIDPLDASYHNSSATELDNISGHRDGNGLPHSCTNTLCPGDNLYPLLPIIRENVYNFPCMGNLADVNNLLEKDEIVVFPNPSSGILQVQVKNLAIKNLVIYNSIGQVVKNIAFTKSNFEIKLEEEGFYFLRFENKFNKIFTKKIFVR